MSTYLRNAGTPWTVSEIQKLKRLIAENTPTRVIGLLLGRSEQAIYSKAFELGYSLTPVNQSPYNRRK
jgi:hypothetical protein